MVGWGGVGVGMGIGGLGSGCRRTLGDIRHWFNNGPTVFFDTRHQVNW